MFTEVINPRFCDTDALGHINNTMLPIWFEGAREPVFKIFMPELDVTQWRLILAKIDVNFHAQIFYGKAVELRTYIGRIGSSSFDVYQELWQNNIRCASGTAVMVNFCYENQCSLKIPAEIQNEMEKHLFVAD